MAEFTDDEKNANYQRVERHIHVINSGRITEDFVEECKQHVRLVRTIFFDMSTVQPEIRDVQFRSAALKAEQALIYLLEELTYTNQINLNIYLSFVEAIKFMADHVVEDSELADIFSSMGI